MVSIPDPDRRGTLIALEPRIRAAFHPLYHEVCERTDLTPGAKIVYTVLVSYHQRFRDVFPGRDRLAKDTGISKRQLVEHMKTLSDRGLLSIERRGLGMTNVYTLLRWPDERSAESAPPVRGNRTGAGALSALTQLEEEGLEQEAGQLQPEEETAAALWSAAMDQLRGEMTRANFETWFDGSMGLRLDDGALVVQASAGQVEALTTRFAPLVKRALDGRAVRFVERLAR